MNIQLRIIGLLAILAVGFLILGPGDEPSDSDHQGGDPKSTTDRHFQPREPTLPVPTYDYGIVGQPGPPAAYSEECHKRPSAGFCDGQTANGDFPFPSSSTAYSGRKGRSLPGPRGASPSATPSYGKRRAYPEPAYRGGYDPSDAQAWSQAGGYRFRPLTEREQKRRQKTNPYPNRYADHYTTPYPSHPQAQATVPPYPPSTPPTESYSFRPPQKSPGARGRWQGPSYRQPDRRFAPSPMAPETSPSYPQWGSTPPSRRMYPNLYRDLGCRLTAR